MDKADTLELLRRGRECWNAWATELLQQREILKKAHVWNGDKNEAVWTDDTRSWMDEAAACFSYEILNLNYSDFGGWVFPGNVDFSSAEFRGEPSFHRATFYGDADFNNAVFKRSANLDEAIFNGIASFKRTNVTGRFSLSHSRFDKSASFDQMRVSGSVTFCHTNFNDYFEFNDADVSTIRIRNCEFQSVARFFGAKFHNSAEFRQTRFHRLADFTGCRFGGATSFSFVAFNHSAIFRSIAAQSMFALEGSKFDRLPDFVGAHLIEAPLHDVEFESRQYSEAQAFNGESPLPERWRALRRLAQQGHDHERALKFWKAEACARRNQEDKPWHLRFWVGLIYGWVSDFGLSISRPTWTLLVVYLLFCGLYFVSGTNSSDLALDYCPLDGKAGLLQKLSAASLVSFHYTAPVTLVARTENQQENLICLYESDDPNAATFDGDKIAVAANPVPFWIQIAGPAQFVISSVLVFLILLAVRNHFRIP